MSAQDNYNNEDRTKRTQRLQWSFCAISQCDPIWITSRSEVSLTVKGRALLERARQSLNSTVQKIPV